MARIPQLRADDPSTPPEAREFLRTAESTMGEVFNALRLLANHPPQAKALIDFVKAVRYRNTLTPAFTELAYTTASVSVRSPTASMRRFSRMWMRPSRHRMKRHTRGWEGRRSNTPRSPRNEAGSRTSERTAPPPCPARTCGRHSPRRSARYPRRRLAGDPGRSALQ